jgi:hypothetical protein
VSSYRVGQRRPVAILCAVVVGAVLVLGLVRMLDGGAAREGAGLAFLLLWCAAGLSIIGVILRSAFAGRRSPSTSERAPEDDSRR